MPNHKSKVTYSGVPGRAMSGTVEYTERCSGREEDGDQHNADCSDAERAASAPHVELQEAQRK